MTEEIIFVEGVDPVQIFGVRDANLQAIDNAFPKTKVTARGNRLKFYGPKSETDVLKDIIQELLQIAKKKGEVKRGDVETLLALANRSEPVIDSVSEPAMVADTGDIILHTHTGEAVMAKTPGQRALIRASEKNDILFAIGPAGTGKTYTSVALAVRALKSRQVKKIILARPAVEAGENLGFLPGDLKEKIDPYLRPLYDALEEMIDHDKLEFHLAKNVIEIAPLAYMRGRTLNNAFVILDEAQNATNTQMKMFLTRIGFNSRAIITGDITQTDLPKKHESGLISIQNILKEIDGISFVYLDQKDVVRHKLVRDIIDAYEKFESKPRK